MKEIKCKITGLVQGVFLRDYIRTTAMKLDIVGTVENMSNGSVEVFAQGHENALMDFIRALEVGSEQSRVEKVAVEWREVHDILKGFVII